MQVEAVPVAAAVKGLVVSVAVEVVGLSKERQSRSLRVHIQRAQGPIYRFNIAIRRMEYPYRNQQMCYFTFLFGQSYHTLSQKQEHNLQDVVLVGEEGDGPLILTTECGSIGEEVEDGLEYNNFLTVGEDFYGRLEDQDFSVDLVRDTL